MRKKPKDLRDKLYRKLKLNDWKLKRQLVFCEKKSRKLSESVKKQKKPSESVNKQRKLRD